MRKYLYLCQLIMEKLLHYTWKHRLYPLGTLATTDDKTVEVIDPGLHNTKDAGPDFFNAKIRVNGTEWVGNVELHLKASDWFRHGHDRDSAYDNVILHVVTEADMEVRTSSGRMLPQMVLTIPERLRTDYEHLLHQDKYPPCYERIPDIPKVKTHMFMSALQTERPDWQDKIHLGAEAAWHPGLCTDPDLEILCLGGSRYLLLEMPFQQWTPAVLRDVRTILYIRGITPVIAHLERFFSYTSADSIERLLDMDVIVQMNAGALLSRSLRRQAFRMVRTGMAQVISSDTHNMTFRRPDIEYGIQALKDAGLGDQAQEILDRGREIYREAAEPL